MVVNQYYNSICPCLSLAYNKHDFINERRLIFFREDSQFNILSINKIRPLKMKNQLANYFYSLHWLGKKKSFFITQKALKIFIYFKKAFKKIKAMSTMRNFYSVLFDLYRHTN